MQKPKKILKRLIWINCLFVLQWVSPHQHIYIYILTFLRSINSRWWSLKETTVNQKVLTTVKTAFTEKVMSEFWSERGRFGLDRKQQTVSIINDPPTTREKRDTQEKKRNKGTNDRILRLFFHQWRCRMDPFIRARRWDDWARRSLCVSSHWLSRAAGRWCESLWLVDGHAFHGVGQVSVSCALVFLFASALLLLGLLCHLLVNGGGLHKLDELRQAWRQNGRVLPTSL